MSMNLPTSNHDEIRRWAALNRAVPVEVELKRHDGEPTKLGFMFMLGSKSAPEFKPISWDNFFALFDLMQLSLVYDMHKPQEYELLELDVPNNPTYPARIN